MSSVIPTPPARRSVPTIIDITPAPVRTVTRDRELTPVMGHAATIVVAALGSFVLGLATIAGSLSVIGWLS